MWLRNETGRGVVCARVPNQRLYSDNKHLARLKSARGFHFGPRVQSTLGRGGVGKRESHTGAAQAPGLSVKRIDPIRYLERHACRLLREGGSHSVYVNSETKKVSKVRVTAKSKTVSQRRYAKTSRSLTSRMTHAEADKRFSELRSLRSHFIRFACRTSYRR